MSMYKKIHLTEPFRLMQSGEAFSVFIDDTGSGHTKKGEPVRFVAVIVKPQATPLIHLMMKVSLDELKETTGATEFHFSDIYQGQGEFRGISIETRLKLFKVFADLVAKIAPIICIQSMDVKTLSAIAKQVELPSLPILDLKEPRAWALVVLLVRASEHIRKVRNGLQQAIVFCDQGLLKRGRAIHLPICPDVIHNNYIYFVDSKIETGIQLADFAAFVLNRHQQILRKKGPNDLEKSFLYATESVTPLYTDMEPHRVRGRLNPKFHFPYVIRELFKKKGERWLIIDERTGLILLPEADEKDKPVSD